MTLRKRRINTHYSQKYSSVKYNYPVYGRIAVRLQKLFGTRGKGHRHRVIALIRSHHMFIFTLTVLPCNCLMIHWFCVIEHNETINRGEGALEKEPPVEGAFFTLQVRFQSSVRTACTRTSLCERQIIGQQCKIMQLFTILLIHQVKTWLQETMMQIIRLMDSVLVSLSEMLKSTAKIVHEQKNVCELLI